MSRWSPLGREKDGISESIFRFKLSTSKIAATGRLFVHGSLLMKLNRERVLLITSLFAIFLVASFVATSLFNSYPYSMDEYSVMVQARIFADGALSREAAPFSSIIAEKWMMVEKGKVFSKYPPALAALLAVPLKLGIPQLLNPLLSTLTAYFVFQICFRHFGSSAAWTTLAILGTSPYFYPYAASFFPQPLALCVATVCLFLLSEHLFESSPFKCFLMGTAIGLMFLARQLDAACLLVVLVLAVAFATPKTGRLRALATLGVGCVPGVLTLFVYNYLQSGMLSISAFPVWNLDFAVAPAIGGGVWQTSRTLIANYVQWFSKYTVTSFFSDFLPYVGVPLFTLFVVGLLTMRGSLTRWAACFIALIVGAYVMHPSTGWPQYGQRYWYVCFGAFMFISAQGISAIQGICSPRSRTVFYATLLGIQLIVLVCSLSQFERRFDLQEAVWSDILKTCPDRTIVILKRPAHLDVDEIQFFIGSDFKRNTPTLGDRLIVYDNDDINKLRGFFPTFPWCFYDFRGGKLRQHLPGFPPKDPLLMLR